MTGPLAYIYNLFPTIFPLFPPPLVSALRLVSVDSFHLPVHSVPVRVPYVRQSALQGRGKFQVNKAGVVWVLGLDHAVATESFLLFFPLYTLHILSLCSHHHCITPFCVMFCLRLDCQQLEVWAHI